jgi:hypothetical protein
MGWSAIQGGAGNGWDSAIQGGAGNGWDSAIQGGAGNGWDTREARYQSTCTVTSPVQ